MIFTYPVKRINDFYYNLLRNIEEKEQERETRERREKIRLMIDQSKLSSSSFNFFAVVLCVLQSTIDASEKKAELAIYKIHTRRER